MKYKVIKEYAGIEVGSEVNIPEESAKYMLEFGYVEPITIEPIKPINGKVQNKAIEPKYKRNAIKTR